MSQKIYVGNLGYNVTNQDLTTKFGAHGTVKSASVIMDRDTGRSKGFGFVEMSTAMEASDAIQSLDGTDMDGRALKLSEAKERPQTSSRPRY